MELKFTIMLAFYSFLYVTYSLHNNVTVNFILNTFSYLLQAVCLVFNYEVTWLSLYHHCLQAGGLVFNYNVNQG